MNTHLVKKILNQGLDWNPFDRVQVKYGYRVRTPDLPQSEINKVISATDLT